MTTAAVSVDARGIVELTMTRAMDTDEPQRLEVAPQDDHFLRPMIHAAAEVLEALEAVGTALYQLRLWPAQNSYVYDSERQQAGDRRLNSATTARPEASLLSAGEIAIPADDAAVSVEAERCKRALMRAGSLLAWEPP
jgi:hypothetical protein